MMRSLFSSTEVNLYHLSYFPSHESWGREQEYFIHSFIISSFLRYSYNMINFTDEKKNEMATHLAQIQLAGKL